ncbi:MAG: hypothetical protein AAF985_13930 [Bacteroidota bacterium]
MKSFFFILFLVLSAGQIGAQDLLGVTSRDNPSRLQDTIPPTNELTINPVMPQQMEGYKEYQQFSDSTMNAFVNGQDSIHAYLMTEWEYDETESGFHGFTVEEFTTDVATEQRQTLFTLLSDENTYKFGPIGKRCDFSPRLGFSIFNKDHQIDVLIATNCDIIKIIAQDGNTLFMEDCDPAHDAFTALCASIFTDSVSITE